jgi:acyl-ACP thioesterase
MLKQYEIPFKIHSSSVNSAHKLDITQLLRLMQDVASEHSALTGTDFYSMLKSSNAFWVITKTRVHFHREPTMFEDMTVRTWPNPPAGFGSDRNYLLIGSDGEIAVSAMSEWIFIDADTRRPRRIGSTAYPINEEHIDDRVIDEPYHRLSNDFDDGDIAYTHIIRASDTDMTGHTNNTVYCRLMLDAFPSSFFAENRIVDFELRYAMESKEGETVTIFRRSEGNIHRLSVRNGAGKTLVTASMTTEQ